MDYETVTTSDWPSDRRCRYRFYSARSFNGSWSYNVGTTNGDRVFYNNLSSEQRVNCSLKYGPFSSSTSTIYTVICLAADNVDDPIWTNSSAAAWIKANTCPKGWGKSPYHGTDTNYVQYAQRCVVSSYQEPIYGYVTRYRDVYYNYISARVAKT